MRADLSDLKPYDPDTRPVDIKLASNECPYSPDGEERERLVQAVSDAIWNRYPDPTGTRLRDLLARRNGLTRENIVIGNGGDELLFNTFLAFGGPEGRLVNTPPTFSVYALDAQLTATPVVDVMRDPETLEVDVDGVIAAAADATIVIITTPNNPTGDMLPLEGIARIAESTDALVLVDEAYHEFSVDAPSAMELIAAHPNVAVLRTLSKAYGLAGLRIGYLAGSPEIVKAYLTVRQPYSVSVLSQALAEEVLSSQPDRPKSVVEAIAERARVYEELKQLETEGVIDRVWPSQGNFHFVRVCEDAGTAHELAELLRSEDSIAVRDMTSGVGTEGCIRISIGSPAENDAVIAALAKHRRSS